jgi:putative peptide zinc metalloprotease protein
VSGAALKTAAPDPSLPRLRRDLEIEGAGTDDNGFPRIVITDRIRGTYFQLSWPHSAVVMAWKGMRSPAELLETLRRDYAASLAPEQLAELVQFLQTHQLTETDETGGWARYNAKAQAGRHSLLMSVVHNYLFFRIPLLRPQKALEAILPVFRPVYGRKFWLFLAVVALIGLYFALRQWTEIQAAFTDALKMQNLAVYAVVLLGLKAIHELGHGLTTVRYGCRVPSMGLAFMLGTPVLYTDTTDSWRLSQRSQRLAIVFAGVGAEMIVAALAVIIWPFLPEGAARQVCFAIVTSALVGTFAVNLNPFMRYDGYFALSDFLRIPNLQARAFDLALWRMRELLFATGRAPPELLARRMHNTLIVYAVLTAIYRIGLYMGIAAVVYHIGSKILGLILGLFEVVIFMAMPIWRELKVWWQMRDEIRAVRRVRWSACAAGAALLVLVTPWMSVVEVPAILQARHDEPLHLPAPARLQAVLVSEGQRVAAGDLLFTATSPDLEQQLARAQAELSTLKIRADRLHASEKERFERTVIENKLQKAREKVHSARNLIDQLQVRAPVSGSVVDIDPELSPGSWQNTKRPLARIVSTELAYSRGLVDDGDLERLTLGAKATFIPEDLSHPARPVRLARIAPASNSRLFDPFLAEKHGGHVLATEEHGEFMLRHGGIDAAFDADGPAPRQVQRGIIRVSAAATSPAMLMWNQIARVLIREQGF